MKNNRPGFTLVELLVVITIIGILMGLLIPAVNAAREAARRNQCATQLKNLSLAAIQYENGKGELPGYLQSYGTYAGGSDPTDPGATGPAAHIKLGTWVVALMPFLDAQPTYEVWTEDRYPVTKTATGELAPTNEANGAGVGFHPSAAPNLAIMQCPSNPNSDGEFARNSYVSNNGLHQVGSGSTAAPVAFVQSMARANGAFNNKFPGSGTLSDSGLVGPKMRLDDMKDGQGYTMLFSENVQALPWNRPGFLNGTDLAGPDHGYPVSARYAQGMVWHYEDDKFDAPSIPWSHGTPSAVSPKHKVNGRGATPGEDIFVEKMNSTNAADIARPSSAHNGVVNVGMADGGTRSITNSIDYRVYQALMTPRGKSSDVPWQEYVMDEDAI